jgi:Na+/H+ antiporter NhaA
MTRLPRPAGEDVPWCNVVGLSLPAGLGFTVCSLIGELACGLGSEQDEDVKGAARHFHAARSRAGP